jgi:hypothetical protein
MTEVIEIGNLSGPKGDPGPPGQGVPTGGTSSQVLTKNSNTNYDASWQPPAGGSPSGTAGGGLSGTYPNPTIADDAITNAKLSNMPASTIKGAVVLGDPVNLTAAQATTIIASGSGGGTTNFLRADGTWASPPIASGMSADVLWDAKGDLAVGSGPDSATKLPAGTDNQILTVDPSTASGLKWATPAASGVAISDTATVDLAGDGVAVPLSANVIPTGLRLDQFSPPTANLNGNSMQIVNLGGATAGLHAMNRNSCDNRYPQLATLTAKGDLWVSTASGVVTRHPVGTDNQMLVADSTQTNGMRWANPAANTIAVTPQGQQVGTEVQGAINNLDTRISTMLENGPDYLRSWCLLFDDFFGTASITSTGTAATGQVGSLGWLATANNSGSVAVPASSIADCPGFVNLQTGTASAAGSASVVFEPNAMNGHPLFIMEWRILMNALIASGTEEYGLRFGLGDASMAVACNDGYYFEYSPGSANMRYLTAKAGVRTNTDSTFPMDIGWHRYRIVSDGGGTVTFTIDGLYPKAVSTNIPSTLEAFSPGAAVNKSLGTAQRQARVDYFYLLWGVNR